MDDDVRYGIFAIAAGPAAIGVMDGATAKTAIPAAEVPALRLTRTSAVLALLQRDDGATLTDLIAGTGWLPHTTRAALTGRGVAHPARSPRKSDIYMPALCDQPESLSK